MEYILIRPEDGFFDVTHELKLVTVIRIYGVVPPGCDELRDIAEHYCRLMVDAKRSVMRAPGVNLNIKQACVRAFDRTICENAEFVSRYAMLRS